jgi:hypothetical protein
MKKQKVLTQEDLKSLLARAVDGDLEVIVTKQDDESKSDDSAENSGDA